MRSAWVNAFRKYVADRFGVRYRYAELDPDWLSYLKGGFRAGYRAGARDALEDSKRDREALAEARELLADWLCGLRPRKSIAAFLKRTEID